MPNPGLVLTSVSYLQHRKLPVGKHLGGFQTKTHLQRRAEENQKNMWYCNCSDAVEDLTKPRHRENAKLTRPSVDAASPNSPMSWVCPRRCRPAIGLQWTLHNAQIAQSHGLRAHFSSFLPRIPSKEATAAIYPSAQILRSPRNPGTNQPWPSEVGEAMAVSSSASVACGARRWKPGVASHQPQPQKA